MTADEFKELSQLLRPALEFARARNLHAQINVDFTDPTTGKRAGSYTAFEPPATLTPRQKEYLGTRKRRQAVSKTDFRSLNKTASG